MFFANDQSFFKWLDFLIYLQMTYTMYMKAAHLELRNQWNVFEQTHSKFPKLDKSPVEKLDFLWKFLWSLSYHESRPKRFSCNHINDKQASWLIICKWLVFANDHFFLFIFFKCPVISNDWTFIYVQWFQMTGVFYMSRHFQTRPMLILTINVIRLSLIQLCGA